MKGDLGCPGPIFEQKKAGHTEEREAQELILNRKKQRMSRAARTNGGGSGLREGKGRQKAIKNPPRNQPQTKLRGESEK